MTGHTGAELSLLLVGNRRMKTLNRVYRGIDAVTDVLSFPLDEKPAPDAVLGDIVLCIPRIRRQAEEYRVTFYEELRRMLVHGLLHLLGYDHEKGARQRRMMEQKEKEILHALSTVD